MNLVTLSLDHDIKIYGDNRIDFIVQDNIIINFIVQQSEPFIVCGLFCIFSTYFAFDKYNTGWYHK